MYDWDHFHYYKKEQSAGILIVATGQDSVARHALTVDTPHVAMLIPLPDSLRDVVYGVFRDHNDSLAGRYWLYAVNLAADPRSIRGDWLPKWDSSFTRRGERRIWTKLDLGHEKYFKVTYLKPAWDMVTTFDTVLRGDGRIVADYAAGGARIFKIEPALRAIVGKDHIEYNNGRRAQFNQRRLHAVYGRLDSIFYRRTASDELWKWEAEHYVSGRADSAGVIVGRADHPSLRMLSTSPGAEDVVGIVYEQRFGSNPTQVRIKLQTITHADSSVPTWNSPVGIDTIAEFVAHDYPSTPVLAPFYHGSNDWGALVASSAHESGIFVRAYRVPGNVHLSNIDSISALACTQIHVTDSNAVLPTIVEDTSAGKYERLKAGWKATEYGLGLQQGEQIFFALLLLETVGNNITVCHNDPRHVSVNHGDCDALHPSLDRAHVDTVIQPVPGGTGTAMRVVPVPLKTQPGAPDTMPSSYQLVWDAQHYVLPGCAGCSAVASGREIWSATILPGNAPMRYFRLDPRLGVETAPDYVYPSNRLFNCVLVGGLPISQIGWWIGGDNPTCRFAVSNDPPVPYMIVRDYSIARLDSAVTPNLETVGYSQSAFDRQRTLFRSRDSSVVLSLQTLPAMRRRDSLAILINLNVSPTSSCTAIVNNFPTFRRGPILPRWAPVLYLDDTTDYLLGIRAITDTLTIGTGDTIVAIRESLPVDSAALDSWLGDSGSVRIIRDIADATSGSYLEGIDTLTIDRSNLHSRCDTMIHVTGQPSGTATYLRLRIESEHVDTLLSNAYQSIRVEDPDVDSSGMGKAERPLPPATPTTPDLPHVRVYPNPLTGSTTIEFEIDPTDAGQMVDVRVVNSVGALVQRFVHEPMDAGTYHVGFSSGTLPAGTYWAVVQTANHGIGKRMILIR
jgi:hypothetical protein